MSRNILDPSAILSTLPNLLPPSQRLESPHDGIAALLHTAMAAIGFRLICLDESTNASPTSLNVLPIEWCKNGPSSYGFTYRHEQSSLEFVLKVTKLGSRTLVNAIATESDKALSLDISTNDFTSPSFYPYQLSESEPLVHGFISSHRVADLLSQFKLKIIQPLIPGLHKEGYIEDDVPIASSSAARPEPQRPRDRSPPPVRPSPPTPPFHPSLTSHIPPDNPLEIGRRDLDPFAEHPNPFAPPSLFPRHGGDGMFVGPDHPIFGPRGRGQGELGPWGGDGYLPPLGAPPGARFDPVGPYPGRSGPGRGRGGGGIPGRGNMRDPDNDEFMPPGVGDMFM